MRPLLALALLLLLAAPAHAQSLDEVAAKLKADLERLKGLLGA